MGMVIVLLTSGVCITVYLMVRRAIKEKKQQLEMLRIIREAQKFLLSSEAQAAYKSKN